MVKKKIRFTTETNTTYVLRYGSDVWGTKFKDKLDTWVKLKQLKERNKENYINYGFSLLSHCPLLLSAICRGYTRGGGEDRCDLPTGGPPGYGESRKLPGVTRGRTSGGNPYMV